MLSLFSWPKGYKLGTPSGFTTLKVNGDLSHDRLTHITQICLRGLWFNVLISQKNIEYRIMFSSILHLILSLSLIVRVSENTTTGSLLMQPEPETEVNRTTCISMGASFFRERIIFKTLYAWIDYVACKVNQSLCI